MEPARFVICNCSFRMNRTERERNVPNKWFRSISELPFVMNVVTKQMKFSFRVFFLLLINVNGLWNPIEQTRRPFV